MSARFPASRTIAIRRGLVVSALLLIVVVIALERLVAVAPTTDVDVVDVTRELGPTALAEPRRCTRAEGADVVVEEVRAAITPRARVTSAMVVACPAAFEELEVTYVGELIGEVLRRDGGGWVLVNDDDYALEVGPLAAHREHRGTNSGLTVWLPDELLTHVNEVGRSGSRGDVVEVRATVVRTDPLDGGGLTLRATELRLLAGGQRVEEPLDVPQLWAAAVLTGLAVVLFAVRRRASRL